MNKTLLAILSALLLTVTCFDAPRAHDDGEHEPQKPTARVLGKIDFPTTTESADAQQAFIQGMLFLHLFEYEFAQAQFARARALDPGFVMAHWGEAMTYNHPIWDEQDRDAALAVLQQLGASPEDRQSRTTSRKEKDYLGALDVLYGTGPKASRDQAYLRHMQQMANNYPADHEVQLFYALAVMGASAGVRDIPAYMTSTAVSQSVFSANPEHPGAAHYLIHGVDDPVHAPLGLQAARALARMAPDAGHSLHMTTHIFVALGMWQDVVDANRAAVDVANDMNELRGLPRRSWGHYNFWMLYGLLQQGRQDEARALLLRARDEAITANAVPQDPWRLDSDRSQVGSLVQMWARYVIETRGAETDIGTWTFNLGGAYDPSLNYAFVQSLRAAKAGDAETAQAQLATFRRMAAELRTHILGLPEQAPGDLLYLDRLAVMDMELEAMLARARDDLPGAIERAAEASRLEGLMPFSFGPPFVDLPAAELHGTLLLAAGDAANAAEAFELQLQRSRLKTHALAGLAEAQEAQGLSAEAGYTRAALARNRPVAAE